MVKDSIANLIVQLKNGSDANKASIVFPYSKMHLAIAEILEKEGYVKTVSKKGKKIAKTLEIELAYNADKTPKIIGVERVSHLSKRVYQKSKDIVPVRNGYGRLIISTTAGLVTDVQARKGHIGGEVLFKIW